MKEINTNELNIDEPLKIRCYPDPILRAPTELVADFDEKLALLVDKMRLAMGISDGVGLAAPQVGITKKIALVSYEDKFYVLINPKVLKKEGEQDGDEGCLSFPGIFAPLKRPGKISVAAFDASGKEQLYEPEGFLARVFLHELDHLEGKLFIDHLSPLKRGIIRKKVQKNNAPGENRSDKRHGAVE
ncbi:peptide deformylase [Synergistales bacterium]|nr:peptide deformylase [Synergistales bacterium]